MSEEKKTEENKEKNPAPAATEHPQKKEEPKAEQKAEAEKLPAEAGQKAEPEKKPEQPAEEKKAEPSAAAAPGPQVAQPAAEQKKPEIKKEKPSNCASCNKSIKRKRWYYRNGKYYCTKRCWQTAVKKKEAPKEAEPAK
ncbi:MAG: hypothetical protein PHP46_00410 [Candidatus Omnitrophica bacterium]|nr:hypothetical protein [Candidatus Omnitrophota bacterium]